MKILVFGANGMIGHQMWMKLNAIYPGQVYGTVRKDLSYYEKFKIFDVDKLVPYVDVSRFEAVMEVLNKIQPDVILNCVGITLRKPEIKNTELTMQVNALFPQKLSRWVAQNKHSRLIHFSTDCVFSGAAAGLYTEDSIPDAQDVYGQTKFLGEVFGPNVLTVRCPIIGREIEGKTELIEWFLAQNHKKIRGYANAIYSGITTCEMSKQIIQIIQKHRELNGLWQISSDPISKYELLKKLGQITQYDIEIEKDESYATNKGLDSKKYRQLTGFQSPSWDVMLKEMMSEIFYS